ncbi:precorrin-6y C5,15-methyltransferase (decarboxylating) subunit CbiE [Ruminococcus sp.]
MKIYIVGTGMDGVKTLTNEAAAAIEDAEVLIGAERMLEPFRDLGKKLFAEYRSDEIVRYIEENSISSATVLMSGDCGFFSGAKKLNEKLAKYSPEVICGISSPVYLCSKLGKEWSDCFFVSLHGKKANIVRNVRAHKKTFFLFGGDITAADVCQKLCDFGMRDISVYIGKDLGYDSEMIKSGKAFEFTDSAVDGLCVMLCENPDHERFIPCGIADDEFIRGNVPMTKSEVRTVVVAGLDIGDASVCWDIGSGTGSGAGEMALRCGNGTVCAVEKNPEAVELTDKNRIKFGCDNIEVYCGEAAEIIEKLPVPDAVFIGGSGGQLCSIIEAAFSMNRNLRLTVTAVSLETLSQCTAIFDKLGLEAEITQIAVTRTRKVGKHTMLNAENPIWIIKMKRL